MSVVADQPGRDHAIPSRNSSAWVVPTGISSTWWVTSTLAGRVGTAGQPGQAAQQILASAEVHPGGRLVQQQQLRVGHQRPGDLNPLALALAQRPELALAQVGHAELGQDAGGPATIGAPVGLAPAPMTEYPALMTMSPTSSRGGIRWARAALVSPIRGRSSNRSTAPNRSPST